MITNPQLKDADGTVWTWDGTVWRDERGQTMPDDAPGPFEILDMLAYGNTFGLC